MSKLMRRRDVRVAVFLVGYKEKVPRYFGDNEGAWPVRVASSQEIDKSLSRMDFEQPIHSLTVLGFVWCPTDIHAKRLKETLDEILLGRRPDDNRLRHGWRHLIEPQIVWPIILNDALMTLRTFWPEFEVHD